MTTPNMSTDTRAERLKRLRRQVRSVISNTQDEYVEVLARVLDDLIDELAEAPELQQS